MMKSLKFSGSLPKLILEGKKTSTWRINDEKDISEGDMLSLRDSKGEEFAKARVISAIVKKFRDIGSNDIEGHESFGSEKEMLETYSKYYSIDATPDTEVKIIRFRLA